MSKSITLPITGGELVSANLFITLPFIGGGFVVSPDFVMEMQRTYPAINIREEFERIGEWLTSNPRQMKTVTGVQRFIGSWIRNVQDRMPRAAAAAAVIQHNPPYIADEKLSGLPVPNQFSLIQRNGDYFVVPQEFVVQMVEMYPKVDVKKELLRMQVWSDVYPNYRRARIGMRLFISKWLANVSDTEGELHV